MTGKVEIKHEDNPFLLVATKRHEAVHRKQDLEAARRFGGMETPGYVLWYINPQNWASREVEAYSAGISYLEEVVNKNNGPN